MQYSYLVRVSLQSKQICRKVANVSAVGDGGTNKKPSGQQPSSFTHKAPEVNFAPSKRYHLKCSSRLCRLSYNSTG